LNPNCSSMIFASKLFINDLCMILYIFIWINKMTTTREQRLNRLLYHWFCKKVVFEKKILTHFTIRPYVKLCTAMAAILDFSSGQIINIL
jgi:hypothetical protein